MKKHEDGSNSSTTAIINYSLKENKEPIIRRSNSFYKFILDKDINNAKKG